jgi:PleD family two-component response regulator
LSALQSSFTQLRNRVHEYNVGVRRGAGGYRPPSEEVTKFLEETVLLVDDDAALLEVMSIVLSSEGYRVITATDGAEALQAART